MKVSVSNKQIIKLALPISVALLIPQISFLTNTAFLGRLGIREMGVNGITSIFYLILAMIGYGLSSGIQIQLSRRAGEEDKTGLAKIFMNGVMLAIMFAFGLMILVFWMAPVIFGLSLHNYDNINLSVDFIFIRIWGLPLLMVSQMLNSFFVSVHRSKYLVYSSLVATIVNVVFDYLLIFGKMGFPELGLAGAAIASVISELSVLITLVVIFYSNRLLHDYPIMQFVKFDPVLSRKSLKVATPLIVQFLFSIGGWQIFFIFVEHLGERELAASQVLRSIFGIVGIGTWAFATACNTMVSNVIGQGRQDEVPLVVRKIALLSFSFSVVTCVLLLAFSTQFLSMYGIDAQMVSFAIPSLQVIVLATLVMSLSTVVFNGVVGTGKTVVNLAIEITCVGSYLVYCYVIIERMRSPLYICWGAEFVYWTTLLTIASLYLKSGRWKDKVI